MLLLLKGAPPANPSVTFALGSQLAFDNSGHVTFSTVTSLGPFDSVELRVGINFDLLTSLTPIPFLTVGPGVSFDTQLGLSTLGGFTDQVSFANTLNSGWTVGGTLQGAVTLSTVSTLTGDLRAVPGVSFTTVLGLAPGPPDISGGTITQGVSFGLLTGFTGTPIFVDAVRFALISDLSAGPLLLTTGFPGPVQSIRFEHQSLSIRFTHL